MTTRNDKRETRNSNRGEAELAEGKLETINPIMLAPPEERLNLMRSLMWDYNIAPENCLEVLEGFYNCSPIKPSNR